MTESGLDRVYAYSVGEGTETSFEDPPPFYAELVTVIVFSGVINRQRVKVLAEHQGRYVIRALEKTYVPGVHHPLGRGGSCRVPTKALEECMDAVAHG